MSDSLEEKAIKAKICNMLRVLAKTHNGTYKLFEAKGTMNGAKWKAGYRPTYTTTEVVLIPWFDIDGIYLEGLHLHGKLYQAIKESKLVPV